MHNQLATEEVAVVGMIDPDANTAATYTTGWVSLAEWGKVAFLVMAGDLGSSATITAKLEQATSSGGAGAKDVTSKSITTLTQAGTDDNKQAWINCRADELDISANFNYVRGSMTVGTATSDSGAVLLAFNAKHGPASNLDATTVDEIVS